jgi:hypothetical protein
MTEPEATPAADRPALPDRLSIDPRSPHHVQAVFQHDVGIRFNGKEREDVEEYCISEGWIRVPAGKTVDRKGHPLMIKLKGKGRGVLQAAPPSARCRRPEPASGVAA